MVVQISLRPVTVALDLTIHVPMGLYQGLRTAAAAMGVSVTTASAATGLIVSGASIGLFWLFAKWRRTIPTKTRGRHAISDAIFVIFGISMGFFGGVYFFWLIFSFVLASEDAFWEIFAGSVGFIVGIYFFSLVVYVLVAPE